MTAGERWVHGVRLKRSSGGMGGVASGGWTVRVEESSLAEEPDRAQGYPGRSAPSDPGETGVSGRREFGGWPATIGNAQNECRECLDGEGKARKPLGFCWRVAGIQTCPEWNPRPRHTAAPFPVDRSGSESPLARSSPSHRTSDSAFPLSRLFGAQGGTRRERHSHIDGRRHPGVIIQQPPHINLPVPSGTAFRRNCMVRPYNCRGSCLQLPASPLCSEPFRLPGPRVNAHRPRRAICAAGSSALPFSNGLKCTAGLPPVQHAGTGRPSGLQLAAA
jgi:hypothetical protein